MRISVVVTCFNLEDYLGEAIQSIQDQTHKVDEIILVHDGCDKPTAFNGVETLFLPNNVGVSCARELGFRLTTGGYVLFMDADDVLPDYFIEECCKVLDKGADIAYPDTLSWSSWSHSLMENAFFKSPKKITLKDMVKFNRILVTSLMKREVYEKTGRFDKTLPIFEDYHFWLRALLKGFKFERANTYLKYRQRVKSRNHQDDKIRKDTYNRIIQSVADEFFGGNLDKLLPGLKLHY